MSNTATDGGAGGPSGALSLGELTALNDEVAALVRAGMPLERGLAHMGGDLRGRLGRMARALAGRLERGESLAEALKAEGDAFPPLYRAVVEAGARSGRLGSALEGMSAFARGYADVRRAIGMAMFYPLVVLSIAYALTVMVLMYAIPRFDSAFEGMGVARPSPLRWAARAGESAGYWAPIAPALLAALVAWWLASGRSASLRPGWSGGPLRWVPGLGSMLGLARASSFADLMALLLEHRVPFADAARLAARATGDAKMERAGAAMAEASALGEPPGSDAAARAARGLPPLLAWLVASGGRRGDLAPALRHAAATYRRRALHRAEVIRVLMPTAFLLGLGSTAVLGYALSLFVPLSDLMIGLSAPR